MFSGADSIVDYAASNYSINDEMERIQKAESLVLLRYFSEFFRRDWKEKQENLIQRAQWLSRYSKYTSRICPDRDCYIKQHDTKNQYLTELNIMLSRITDDMRR